MTLSRLARITVLAGIAVAALAITVAALAITVVIGSNRYELDRRYPLARIAVAAAADQEAAVRGKRLADITGCTDCHRPDLRGGVFIDDGWMTGRYYAANLTLRAQSWSDEDLARLIRTGVRPDGRGVFAMPSFGFINLTDSELADIIAFIRSLPAGGDEQPAHWIGPEDQWKLWRGRALRPAIAYVEAERNKRLADAGSAHAAGRHLSGIVCIECHGGDLGGDGWSTGSPDLAVVRVYNLDAFRLLLRTGVGADGKEHGLMSRIAVDRLHHLSDNEIAAIHAYLLSRAGLPR